MANQSSKQNKNLIFSERANEIIGELVEKYKLDKEIEGEKEVKKRLEDAKSFLQKEGIKLIFSKKIEEQLKKGRGPDEILASRKLKKVIGELSEKKVSFERITINLQSFFDLPQKDAEKLNKDIQEKLPFLIEKSSNKESAREEKPLSEPSQIKRGGVDTYQEPIG